MKKKSVIGIIGAMQVETDRLALLLDSPVEHKIGAFTFICGTYLGHYTVVSRCGVGKVNAAACASAMILKYSPSLIINIGVGGSLTPDLGIGDAAVADLAVEHDLVYGVLGDTRGSVFFPDGHSEIFMPTDMAATEALYEAARACGVNVRRATVASGDRFISEVADRTDIADAFGASVCEMEGAAVVHACRLFNTPCAVLRTVSDNADGSAEDDFPVFARRSADVASGIVEKFIVSLE